MHFKAVKKSRKGSVFGGGRGGVFTAVKGDAKFESMNVKGVLFVISKIQLVVYYQYCVLIG